MNGQPSSQGSRSRKLALLLAWWSGIYEPPDRRALRAIWEALVHDDPAFRVLFVGVRPCARGLTRSPRHATVVTIDRDPRMRFFGAREHHVVSLERVTDRVRIPVGLAVVNGVLGAGIDTVAESDEALRAVGRVLSRGGILVLGVNEERATMPDLAGLGALDEFRPVAPPPFGVSKLVLPSPFEASHTFLFFERT